MLPGLSEWAVLSREEGMSFICLGTWNPSLVEEEYLAKEKGFLDTKVKPFFLGSVRNWEQLKLGTSPGSGAGMGQILN